MIDGALYHPRPVNVTRLGLQPQGRHVDSSEDPFNLQRFIPPQDAVMEDVISELQQGRKTSHWMWFVLPQLAVLGSSPTAKRFGLESLREARAYLTNPILGQRLRQCCGLLLRLGNVSALEVFGHPDHLKLHSCLTLFHLAAPRDTLFTSCLAKFYAGQLDRQTQRYCGDGLDKS
jgi:uncharacterized protein (DUF1810 family)